MDIRNIFLLDQRRGQTADRAQLPLSPRGATRVREDLGLGLNIVSLEWIIVSRDEKNIHLGLSHVSSQQKVICF
jgi:hypothetical protein